MNKAAIDTVVALAGCRRLVKIWYKKLSDPRPTPRVIEPYQFLEHNDTLMVRAWQVDPFCYGEAWRTFRCDRIHDASDGGGEFDPRCDVDIASGQVDQFIVNFDRATKSRPEDLYRKFLVDSIRDHEFSDDEQVKAENLAMRVTSKHRKVIHAQIFAEVLFDALLDHEISEEEEEFIDKVRGFMETIGWAP